MCGARVLPDRTDVKTKYFLWATWSNGPKIKQWRILKETHVFLQKSLQDMEHQLFDSSNTRSIRSILLPDPSTEQSVTSSTGLLSSSLCLCALARRQLQQWPPPFLHDSIFCFNVRFSSPGGLTVWTFVVLCGTFHEFCWSTPYVVVLFCCTVYYTVQ